MGARIITITAVFNRFWGSNLNFDILQMKYKHFSEFKFQLYQNSII
ncbi:MAG: hypothetical protein JWM28_283 [Chitinophagaceae bacterium]|nr:hypothetical protein [Chitinophagaceae bacterium]